MTVFGEVDVLLRTRCGCERVARWTLPLPMRIHMALRPPKADYVTMSTPVADLTMPVARVFERAGVSRGVQVYEELEAAVRVEPPVVRLSAGENADAIRRFMASAKAADPVGWVRAQSEFLKEHGSAHQVHLRDGDLVGAWYSSPLWGAACEGVAIMVAQRALLLEEE